MQPTEKDNLWLLAILIIGLLGMIIGVAIRSQRHLADPVPTPTPAPAPTATSTPTNTPTPTSTPTCTNAPTAFPTEPVASVPEVQVAVCTLELQEDLSGLISPTEEEVEYMAKVIHGEAGICSDLQKSAVAWCVCNRVDWFEYPDNVIDVITQPHQFKGYAPTKEPTAEEYAIAWDVLYRWLNDLPGRTLPKNYLYFHAENGVNVFTTNHMSGAVWDWSLPDIYQEEP